MERMVARVEKDIARERRAIGRGFVAEAEKKGSPELAAELAAKWAMGLANARRSRAAAIEAIANRGVMARADGSITHDEFLALPPKARTKIRLIGGRRMGQDLQRLRLEEKQDIIRRVALQYLAEAYKDRAEARKRTTEQLVEDLWECWSDLSQWPNPFPAKSKFLQQARLVLAEIRPKRPRRRPKV